MSDFGRDQIVEDRLENTTVGEGVDITRRSVLRFSASSLAALGLLAGCTSAPTEEQLEVLPEAEPAPDPEALATEEGLMEIEAFLDEFYPRARRIVQSGGEQEERYLMNTCALLTRLEIPDPLTLREHMMGLREKHGRGRRDYFEVAVYQFMLKPGKGFSHHDHRDYNGVILGVEGELQARNYDILGGDPVPPKGQTFQIRQTRDDLILPGGFSTLSRTRDNVHEVIAGPDGARVIDAFTYFVPGARSYSMDVDSTPRDAERKIYDAAWS